MKKILLLFGTTGSLGSEAIKFFLNEEFDKYYFFTRRSLNISSSKDFEQVIINDISIEENIEKTFNSITQDSNAVYFLFSTIGGYWAGKKIKDTPYEEWLKLLNINLNISFLISKYFSKLVRNAKGGSICFVSAYSSFKPEENKAAYGVSKNSLNFLVKALALEGKEIKLSANAVAPYAIDTVANREWISNVSLLVSPVQICEIVQDCFSKWQSYSGNIIRVPNK